MTETYTCILNDQSRICFTNFARPVLSSFIECLKRHIWVKPLKIWNICLCKSCFSFVFYSLRKRIKGKLDRKTYFGTFCSCLQRSLTCGFDVACAGNTYIVWSKYLCSYYTSQSISNHIFLNFKSMLCHNICIFLFIPIFYLMFIIVWCSVFWYYFVNVFFKCLLYSIKVLDTYINYFFNDGYNS